MDNLMFSIINSVKMGVPELKKVRETQETDFSQVLEAEKKALESSSETGGKSAIKGETEPKGKEEKKAAENRLQNRADSWSRELMPLLRYLQLLAKKHPDTLSLGEKRMLRVEDDQLAGVGVKELKKLLSEKNLKLSDFSPKEMEALLKTDSRSKLLTFLDSSAQAKKEGKLPDTALQAQSSPEKTAEQLKQVEKSEVSSALKREEVIQQIIDKMEIRQLESGTQATLRLNPEFLGELKVKLIIKDEKVTAHFQTTSRLVKDLLTENRQELIEGLKEKGLSLDELSAEFLEEMA